MAPCPIFAGLDHGILVNGVKCPACGSIDAGSSTSSSQSTSISSTQASSESSAVTYAGYTGADSMASTYTIWTEGWTCAIKHNSPVSYDSLKNTFRNTIQVQTISFFKNITQPDGHGHWLLASNHLNPEKPAPVPRTHR